MRPTPTVLALLALAASVIAQDHREAPLVAHDAGADNAQQCGWLKDRYGVSWQIVPRVLIEPIGDPDQAKCERVTAAMLKMKKLDIQALKQAAG